MGCGRSAHLRKHPGVRDPTLGRKCEDKTSVEPMGCFNKGEAVCLIIYEYGMVITKAQDLDKFHAASERSVPDIAAELQDIWSETFQADAVVWRMWANHFMRGLDRSTWDPVSEPNCEPADLPAERHLAGLSRSSDLVLQAVNAAIEYNKRLKASRKLHGERFESQERLLLNCKRTIDTMLAGTRLPSLGDVMNTLPMLTNLEDN
ncbi:hypothetical protein PHMEG_00017584 [Phytophthora megakarya]|uniref:Uncharacterized protein n=1 Tax=Phytophthora megakarya TaxID=4795 RepID=A0A225VWH3_9STRA|nr:hypothetical protein PHMEG_00017584 [Phytophthora megakarya]